MAKISTPQLQKPISIPNATVMMLAVVAIALATAFAWFTGEGQISRIFAQLNLLQQSPPMWLQAPMVASHYLLFPTVALFLCAVAITRISPQPKPWSRTLVISVLLILVGRYVIWRSLSTLNFNDLLNGVASTVLFAMEMLGLLVSILQLLLLLRVRDRHIQADQMQLAVMDKTFLPSVAVFIPTYDEPEFILRRTIIGCQAMDYPDKTIYLLDDTHRPEIRLLAQRLGCEYRTRPNNDYAKAGSLNSAIAATQSDLIASFDADFVPTRNFLLRTIGFFQDPTVGLVQTPQSFYNPDPIARNLGLEDILTPEEEVFYRQIQPMRDGVGSVVCSGTSFVVRRSALETSGGFVTDSLSEDYFTAIRLASQGHKIIYLDEKLSAGLAAENITAHAIQRLRWARGTLQAFFIETNPLTIPGLKFIQRLGHLEGILHWFTSISRIIFLIAPLFYAFGVIPIRSTPEEIIYFFLPYYFVQITVFSWLNHHSRSAILSDVYSLVLAFPLAVTVVQAMLSPFGTGFKVTPKGTSSQVFRFNWSLAWPLVLMFILTACSIWLNLGECLARGNWALEVTPEEVTHLRGLGIGWIWSLYNLVMIGTALLVLLDVPRPSPYDWFDLRRVVRLQIGDRTSAMSDRIWWGTTTAISEVGANITLTQRGLPQLAPGETRPIQLSISEELINLRGLLTHASNEGEFPCVTVQFQDVTLAETRKLVELLYCRPGQWQRWNTPGELQSLWILVKTLFRPRVLTGDIKVKAMAVSKG
ncbi:glycosyltransferase [Leptothoe sp. PORK10 BA2]|uniref:glycosyltransferase n=1 Tax=Leptothoe sp. PORK10 BA2 TaxID=3110254 RepID=UPI002B217305|nr:glycosyltransferase family 2 protein [Leptothoe sp. PORK10 BA2]MEA5463255.1 glycosyltransferase family 2 protein [Leptothoe sp. PORK10 BA2]